MCVRVLDTSCKSFHTENLTYSVTNHRRNELKEKDMTHMNLKRVLVLTVLFALSVTTVNSQEQLAVVDLNALAVKGEALANEDPMALELRTKQRSDAARRGFDIGMGVADGHTAPGPGKDRVCASLSPIEQRPCYVAVSFSVDRNKYAALATKGAELAKDDHLLERGSNLDIGRNGTEILYRLGFHIGIAAAEGQTLPGPGKQKIQDSLSEYSKRGFATAVKFSLDRNRYPDRAARGAAIADQDPTVAAARTAQRSLLYWLGFDIGTAIFGDPALGAQGNTSTGPGSLGIRDSLSPDGQRGFNAAVTFHLSRKYTN